MGIPIGRENLFKEKLQTGINLLTGAGFSCLSDENGNHLPTVEELCPEVCKKFNVPETFGNDLESISALADGRAYQEYLRKRFKVSECNKDYYLLNRLNLKSYITTNIDNIIHLIVEETNRYYLRSITYYGGIKKQAAELCYIPLHGEVMNDEYPLYFGKFDLAVVDEANGDLFKQMHTKLMEGPVLFWGYGFHDSGVLKTVQKILSHGSQDIWVQCMPGDKKQMTLFSELGCNIIESDTKGLFDWIRTNIPEYDNKISDIENVDGNSLKEYRIPTINQVPTATLEDFYIQGKTQWYSVLSKQAVELEIVNDLYNEAIVNKNVILISTDLSGKTTALMQIALKISADIKLFINDIIPEQARYIVSQLKGKVATVFVDDCALDMEAYKILAGASNIRTIAASSDYSFEASKHLLGNIKYKKVILDDLTESQARRFYSKMEPQIRNQNFVYKKDANEKFSLLEMMLNNVRNVLQKERVKKIVGRILKENKRVFEVVALTSYLSKCNSALSTDIMFSFFNAKSYNEVKKLIEISNGFLRELNIGMTSDQEDQDYYAIRSKLFLYHLDMILTHDKEISQEYATVIEKFVYEVTPFIIYNFHIFRRNAYDAKIYYKLFGEHANQIYEYLYSYDHNPYTLQQWALCRSHLGEYKKAFADIDKALVQLPNNFSMQNSRAIILFEANKNDRSELGIEKKYEAMDILEKCYTNDKKKIYHAQKYAEFALHLYNENNEKKYISQAKQWLNELINAGDSVSKKTKRYFSELNQIV